MKGRQRGRNNNGGKPRMHHQGGGGGGQQRNFGDNAGRMRGNAQQLLDKYLALARDASQQGDRVLAENYFQHADHYYRVVNARFEGQQNNNQQRRFNGPGQYDGQDGQGNYQDYNNGSDNHMGPGPSQNLLPQSSGQQSGGDSQPHVQNQPQQGYQQQPQQQYQQPQQSHGQGQHNQGQHNQDQQGQGHDGQGHDDGDIGLPPTLFGGDAAPQGNQSESSNSAEAPASGGERPERGSRPRQGTRRRFGPRREGQPRTPAEPVDA